MRPEWPGHPILPYYPSEDDVNLSERAFRNTKPSRGLPPCLTVLINIGMRFSDMDVLDQYSGSLSS